MTTVGTSTTGTTGLGVKGGTGLLWSVRNDHQEVQRNIENLLTMTDVDAKQRLFNDTVRMLAQHDVAEEVVIYPAANRIGDETLYKLAIDQTIQMERLLYDLDQTYGHEINKLDFNRRLTEFRDVLMQHVRMEETELLPHLEKSLKQDDLNSLNTWFQNTKTISPTRPHPEGPSSPAGNLVSAPLMTFLDSLRDLGKKFS